MTQSWKEISEQAATAELADLYLEIKRALRVPIVNLPYRVWASEGKALPLLWSATRPNLQTLDFEMKADSLRSEAAEEIGYDIQSPSHRTRLNALGMSDAEIGELRRELDVFHYISPKLLLHCALLKRTLGSRGYHGTGHSLAQMEPGIPSQAPKSISMVDPHSAGEELRRLLEQIRTSLKLPALSSDYRALAKWPDYLRLAWADLQSYHKSPYYEAHQKNLQRYALKLVSGLPGSARITPEDARRLGLDKGRLVDLVEPFFQLLPGLTLDIAFCKIALDGQEAAQKSPYPVEMVARA